MICYFFLLHTTKYLEFPQTVMQTVGIDYTLVEEVRCLQINPSYSSSLKTWMETNGYRKGIIKVDSIYIGDYNSNPYAYLKDSSGHCNYDVIFYGALDINGGQDLSAVVADATKKLYKKW